MISLTFVLLCFVLCPFCVCREEGEACKISVNNVTNLAGTCKRIDKCPYAMKVLYEDEKKPPMCWWDDDVRIVCCPTADVFYRTGVHGRLYDSSSDGVKRSANTICRYDGNQHLCCPARRASPRPRELGCEPLTPRRAPSHFTIAQRIAWDKCMANQQYIKPCVAGKDTRTGRVDKHRLIRVTRCHIPENRFRIAGGDPAIYKEFPHMAALGFYNETAYDVEWVGGGSLIDERFILTAGHVLIDPQNRPLRYALLGTVNKTDVRNGSLYNVVRRIPHPLYDYSTKQNDIALVELDRPVMMSEFIRPICLPVPSFQTDNSRRTIAGWGRTSQNSGPSQILHMTDEVFIADHSTCTKLESNTKFHYNSTTTICAKGSIQNMVKSADTCEGDSGGPLMLLLEKSLCSYAVDGVVSFGPHCGSGEAAVYSRVAAYLDWVVRTAWPDDWQRLQRADYD
ncbi:venom serine protease Bi-VSP [Bicyclus anynana]|uniref:Venom serine protease Bi-VSP n=1 Tax=Bicyclus anynana TaxID=110368 RepID=A0A6J1N4E1_BICAN|nr:venom serine protease Bi-VSP [Bicyclus anynana]